MTRKHAELEREFIDDLLQRTGHTLGEWMTLIDAAGLVGKNEIIDWLRPKGFTFANASWLERIHNNGGRPIYIDTNAPSHEPAQAQPQPRTAATPAVPRSRPHPAPVPIPAPIAGTGGNLAETLARGKAFRPLAEMLVRQIEALLPTALLVPAGDLVSITNPTELAILQITPREIRLGLRLGDKPVGNDLVRARIPGAGPHVTHMLVLTDARQIDAAMLDLIGYADQTAKTPA